MIACRLTGDNEDEDWGFARGIRGLFAEAPDGLRRVEFEGCEPRGGLQRAVGRIGTHRAMAGNANIGLLDAAGTEMGRYFASALTVVSACPAIGGLLDLTVDLTCDTLPEAEPVWRLAASGALDRTGMWHGLGPAGRHAWLSVALARHGFQPVPTRPAGTAYELDGRFVTDIEGFYCAVGEAVNGPGGYFGWNLDALDDCLSGGWGAEAPFTLVWCFPSVARNALEPELFEVVLDVFRGRDIEVAFPG